MEKLPLTYGESLSSLTPTSARWENIGPSLRNLVIATSMLSGEVFSANVPPKVSGVQTPIEATAPSTSLEYKRSLMAEDIWKEYSKRVGGTAKPIEKVQEETHSWLSDILAMVGF